MSDSLPDGWSIEPLGELANVISGGTPSRNVPHFWDDGTIPWVTPTDITGTQGKYISDSKDKITKLGLKGCSASLLPSGSILMTSRATLGEAKISTMPACTNQGFKSLVTKPGVSNEFLYYQIQRTKQQYARFGSGSTFLEVGKKDTDAFPVMIPDEARQDKIAELLSLLDTQIEATELLIAKQERVRAGMIQDLFTRGLDEHGQLRPPRDQAPHLYHQTQFGLLPLEWEVSPLLNLVPRAVYGISDTLSDNANGLPILRMNNIQAGKIDVSELKYSSKALPQGLLLRTGDVLFNRTNSMEHVGKSALWNDEVEKASFASYLVRLHPDPARLDAQFLCHWLNRPEVQIEMRRYATPGVHQVNINPTNLRRVNCAHPTDTEEQRAIVKMVASSDAVIDSNIAMAEMLHLQKFGLMQDLLTGTVSVAPLLEQVAA